MAKKRRQSAATLPSNEDLRDLPLRAIVAYAIRAARRVQPLFDPPQDHRYHHLLAIDLALTLAEPYVGSEIDADELTAVVRYDVRAAHDDDYDVRSGFYAIRAVAFAASAALNANNARADDNDDDLIFAVNDEADIENDILTFDVDDDGATKATRVVEAAERAAAAAADAASIVGSQDEFIAASRQDFKRLKARGLGEYPDPGETFSLSTRNFLGKLWPDGEPDWYQPSLRKMRKSLKEAAAVTEAESPKSTTTPSAQAMKSEDKPDEVKSEINSIWQRLEGIKGAPEAIADLKSVVSGLRTQLDNISSKAAINAFREESKAALDKQVDALGAVERQAAEVRNSINAANTEIGQLNSRVSKASKTLEEEIQTAFEKSKQVVTDDLSQLERNVEARIKSHRETVRIAIEASEAHTYWVTKKQEHRTAFRRWAVATAAAAALSVCGVWYLLLCVLADQTEFRPWNIGLVVFTATVSLLVLRLLSRITMSNLHLATEADERVVMTKTYTAFTTKDALAEEHRTLVLNALFRPSTTGLVNEDAVSPSMLDFATRIASLGKT